MVHHNTGDTILTKRDFEHKSILTLRRRDLSSGRFTEFLSTVAVETRRGDRRLFVMKENVPRPGIDS